jgi:hypothetical protein
MPPAEGFGTVPNAAASFSNVPQNAEAVGTVPNASEGFRTMPPPSELRDKYTLSVREVSRMFESAGVARSERSIVNWCQPNSLGVGKLDAYFDPNERKYFITPESVGLAIAEEKAKAAKHGTSAEVFGKVPTAPKTSQPSAITEPPADAGKLKALEAEVYDLKITNRAKDYFIEQMKGERESFAEERKEFVTQLVSASRRVGELESQLLQIESPPRLSADDETAARQ